MSTNKPRKTGSGSNPNSIANLNPANRAGFRKKMTKNFVTNMLDYLEKDRAFFLKTIKDLPPAQFAKFYLELTKILLPSVKEVNTTSDITQVDWSINMASTTLAQPAPLPTINIEVASEAIVLQDKKEDDED